MSGKIEISRELIEAVAKEMNRLGYGHHEHHAESILHAIQVAAPVVERQPVAYRRFDGEGNFDYWDHEDGKGGSIHFPIEPLYTSPPAPAAVLLPERFPDTRGLKAVYCEGWNACLDKVKELNQ